MCFAARAQESCDVEAKLLLAPAAVQAAVPALGAKRETHMDIYFFDTDNLDLLAQGVILRLRSGADAELTVKIRHPQGKAFSDPSARREKFKCEVDFVGGQGVPSYSLQTSYGDRQIPTTGESLFQSLSDPQKQLLKEAQVSIDWSRVKRIADIKSTAWRSKTMPGFEKLDLEFWQFPGGQVLEVSSRGGPQDGPKIADALRKLASSKGLAVNGSQLPKTSTVLREITHGTVH
jgi:hypothetical protein